MNYSTFETYKFADDDGWRVSSGVYSYGMLCAPKQYAHWKAKLRDVPLRHMSYRPVPWDFQYDMECWITFNWFTLWKEEIKALEDAVATTNSPAQREALSARLGVVRTDGPTGLPRHEHLLRASEIRWPTYLDHDERWVGVVKRHEWPERIYREALNPEWTTPPVIAVFGGAAQGKTTMLQTLMLHLYAHYEGTAKGASGIISTINEDKMNGATWPALDMLVDRSADNISRYAGHEKVTAGWTLSRRLVDNGQRTDKIDTGNAVVSGVLLGINAKKTHSGDKLTGAHGMEGKMMIVDEAQSASDAPLTVVTNMMSTVPRGRKLLALSGNFATKTDTLGKNIKPVGGWESLAGPTDVYDALTQTGLPCRVLHLDNLRSPGMSDPEFYHELFTPTRLAEQVPNEAARSSPQISRMIRGWYDVSVGDADMRRDEMLVVDHELMRSGGALDYVEVDPDTAMDIIVLDAAPEMKDRNVAAHIRYGWHEDKNVFVPEGYREMPPLDAPASLATQYVQAFTLFVKGFLANQDLPVNTLCVIDSSHYATFAAAFEAEGMALERMVYVAEPANPAKPKTDGYGHVEAAFQVSDGGGGGYGNFGYYVAQDRISLGAWLFRRFAETGAARGFDPDRVAAASPSGWLDRDAEFYSRKLFRVDNKTRGGAVWKLSRKGGYADGRPTSPDWQDLWFMAAYQAALRWGMIPGVPGERVSLVTEARLVYDPFGLHTPRVKPDPWRMVLSLPS